MPALRRRLHLRARDPAGGCLEMPRRGPHGAASSYRTATRDHGVAGALIYDERTVTRGGPVRPSTISMIFAGLVVGLGGLVLCLYAFVERPGGKPWFFWIAPLLAIGFAAVMVQLVVMYWMKVGRL